MKSPYRWPQIVVTSGLVFLAACLAASAQEPAVRPGLGDFEERPANLKPRRPRSEAEQDKVDAAAWYAHGRLLMDRGELNLALRRFERAWRYDPESVSLLSEVVPIAAKLGRIDEAVRYAVLGAEREVSDATMLMRLSSVAAEQRQWGRAARLYERIVEKLREDKEANPFSLTMAQLEIGRLNFIERNYKRSADAFAAARDVLATPEKFDLNDGMVKLLVDKPEQTYGLMAESFFEAERYDEALAMFRKVDQAQKKPGLLAFQEARIAVRKKQPDAAIAALEKYFAAGLDEAGDEPYELFAEAVRLKHGPKQDANAKPDAIGKPDPTSPEEKRVAEIVLQRLEQLAAKAPKNVPLLVTVARRQRDAGRLDDAEKTFRAAVNELKAAELWGELVETLRLKGAVEPVVDVLADALAKGGTLPTLDGEKLEVAEKLVADKAFAAKLIESARKRPADGRRRAAALYVAALVAVKIEQFDQADELFDAAIKVGELSTSQTLLTWGLEMFLADQPRRAARVFQRAVDARVRPDLDSTLYYYLAGALEMDGRTDEALAAVGKALNALARAESRGPKRIQLESRRAWISYHAKRYDAAQSEYQKLIEKFESTDAAAAAAAAAKPAAGVNPAGADPAAAATAADDEDDKALVHSTLREARLVLSNIEVQRGRLPAAEEWLEQVLDEFPEDVGAKNDLGYLWADQNKRLNRAIEMCRQAVEAEPDNHAYRDSLGWALYRLGRFEPAVKELEAAVAGDDEPDGVVLEHLGDAQWAAGQADAARATWKRAVEAFEREKESTKAKAVAKKLADNAKS